MLSQSPGVYIILGAVISSTLLIINNLWMTGINNKLQLEREKEQGIRQQESDQKKWYREKTYDCYRKAIEVLKKLMQVEIELERNEITIDNKYHYLSGKVDNLQLDFICEFDIIIMGHPSKNSEEFKEKISTIISQMKQNPSKAQILVTEMMEYDPRIKDI
jgi:hypothetical protein